MKQKKKKNVANRYNLNKRRQQNQKITPGKKSYASATKYGKEIMLVGDSQLRGIRRNVFNNSFDKVKRYIKPFGGAKKDMKHFIIDKAKARYCSHSYQRGA